MRHRLNPHGNREANRALHAVVLNRIRREPRTQEYSQAYSRGQIQV